ncbi:MAG: four helix bundle protein [Saprospiraceae bacterium]
MNDKIAVEMEHESKTKYDPLREKSFNLAVRIVRLCRYLNDEKKEYTLSKQLLRCGTNPGAMIREAANAESPMDFVHKLGIAQKETAETQYWLELLLATGFLTEAEFRSIYHDSEEVLKLLRSSILTKKKKMARE